MIRGSSLDMTYCLSDFSILGIIGPVKSGVGNRLRITTMCLCQSSTCTPTDEVYLIGGLRSDVEC